MRVRAGLQALFDFSEGNDKQIRDVSGMRRPIELQVETPDTIAIRNKHVEFTGKAFVRSKRRAVKVHQACSWTNELTVETWIEPADTKQKGPARIVSFSRDGSQRNFTLGQDGNRFDFRLRTTRTSDNGIPSLSTKAGTVKTGMTHVVYTRSRDGLAQIYLDGKSVARAKVPGDLSNWDINFRLILGNEQSGDRVWKGKMHLVAIYNRALTAAEVKTNFVAGHQGSTPQISTIAYQQPDPFRSRIAPLLSLHCLECHDSSSQKGGLDLSLRSTALAGGESGEAIVPGKIDESLLWESIESGEMPPNRPPLKDEEKNAFNNWIASGAKWTVDKVDPAVFLRSRKVDGRLLKRLTVDEYIATVQASLGVDISEKAKKLLPKDLRADGFENTAYNLTVDLKHVEIYAQLAREISSQIDGAKLGLQFCKTKDLNERNLQRLVSGMGRWILRGPLDDFESVAYLNIAQTIRDSNGSFSEAVEFLVEAMVQSPRFIYQVERQRGDGTLWDVDAHTLANRISYVAWGRPPDQELFDLAVSGRLIQHAVLESQVERLLQHEYAELRSNQFVEQWLHLGRLKNLLPSPEKFPDWNAEIADDMRKETLQVWNEVVWNRKQAVAAIFDADFTFLTPALARHYQLKNGALKDGLVEKSWQRVDLKNIPGRRGILTHASLLTVGGDEASMVSRGLFVLDDILRGVVNDPPACVDTTPVPTKAGLTQRSIALARIANKNCGGCHARFEPLAFGLERFDGLGGYAAKDEHGNRLREDGEIQFPGDAAPMKFRTSKELATAIATNKRTTETIVWKLTQFSLGRPLGPADIEQMEWIQQRCKDSDFTYASMLKALLMSDLIRKIQTEPYPEEP